MNPIGKSRIILIATIILAIALVFFISRHPPIAKAPVAAPQTPSSATSTPAAATTIIATVSKPTQPKPSTPAASQTQKPTSQPTPTPIPTPSPTPIAIPPRSTASVCNASLIDPTGYDPARVISRDACDLINNLYADGRAAGNVGDTYENRDNLHVNLCEDWSPNPTCPADHRLFPQHEWLLSGSAGRRTDVHAGITVGQASWAGFTVGDGTKYGIPHDMYRSQNGADELYAQYTHNNLYIYPSLTDDSFAGQPKDASLLADPETLNRSTINIANTPYVIGSKQIAKAGTDYYHVHDASGSDLPFVKIAMLGLASFRPDVKTALQNGPVVNGSRISFLMPTLEAMIRHAHRSVQSEGDYLSSIAHRSSSMAHYFSGGQPRPEYDPVKLVRITNALTLADIPPLVQLRVVSEDFGGSERYFDTPGAIARNMPMNATRSITVSAAGSIDLDGSTSGHEYQWRLLDSPSSGARIAVDASDPSKATITFTSGSSVDRIDVGVFVRKAGGTYYSVPGIISAYIHS